MSPERLCTALQNAAFWLPRFRLKSYPAAFEEYCREFGPLFEEALSQCGEDTQALAESLLDEIEALWKKERPWNRSAVRADTKQMLVDYLSPMLLSLEKPGGAELCKALREGWTARRPRDPYLIASFEGLQKGFKNALMGIEIQRETPKAPRDFFDP